MSEAIKVVYSDVEIVYSEGANVWEFVLRGRSRTTDSLAKAKEVIDKVPVAKRKVEAFEAWMEEYGSGFQKVKVTSFAGFGYDREPEFWVSHKKKGHSWDSVDRNARNKVSQKRLFQVTSGNEAIMATIKDLRRNRSEIDKEISASEKRLVTIPAPKPEKEEEDAQS